MKTKSIFESLGAKFFLIFLLILLLQIPLTMVQQTIRERAGLKSSVVNEVSHKWGRTQVIQGPVISIPVLLKHKKQQDDKNLVNEDLLHILPNELVVEVKLIPYTKRRSIYNVLLYQAEISLKADFSFDSFVDLGSNVEAVLWDQAVINIGVTDLGGLNAQIALEINEDTLFCKSGSTIPSILKSGVHQKIDLSDQLKQKLNMSTKISLNGSQSFHILPLGKETKLKIQSKWPHPSFSGRFLPDSSIISQSGFKAFWQVIDLNRNHPQIWIGDRYNIANNKIGLHLIEAVDEYQKNTRASKYSLLLIALPFILLFFFEVINNRKIHPMQYLIFGAGLAIFFLLLISITEVLGFNLAYLISALACWSIVSLYSRSVMQVKKLNVLLSLSLAGLFAFLFVILQMESYALLVGSLGLFFIIAGIMFFTRKIDWYAQKE